MISKFFVKFIHLVHIDKDQDYKNILGSLLGEPETKFEPAEANRIQYIREQDAKSIKVKQRGYNKL